MPGSPGLAVEAALEYPRLGKCFTVLVDKFFHVEMPTERGIFLPPVLPPHRKLVWHDWATLR